MTGPFVTKMSRLEIAPGVERVYVVARRVVLVHGVSGASRQGLDFVPLLFRVRFHAREFGADRGTKGGDTLRRNRSRANQSVPSSRAFNFAELSSDKFMGVAS